VEVKPQGDSAGRAMPAEPGLADAAQAMFQVPEVLGEQPGSPLNDRIKRRQQLGGGDLVERAWARAHRGGRAPELPGDAGRGADPAQMQPTPYGLAQRRDDGDAVVAAVIPAGLPDPLTQRELTILRFLATSMSTMEIADELCLSVNTVKTHLAAIYRKLPASRRRDAVLRARELELI
jgi:DNA-binding CsgD family transcriptional regulator